MTVSQLGDAAVVFALDERVDAAIAARAAAFARRIRARMPDRVADVVPAFASVAVFCARGHCVTPEWVEELRFIAGEPDAPDALLAGNEVELPVHYGGESGPDLPDVARHTGLSEAEVIARHTGADYLVHAIGFAPGFPYLGGLPPSLATPRRGTPRANVPAGSVGIGGAQTGVYPMATPGGWNLIGRTPLRLFDLRRERPALLQAGDRVRFRAIEAPAFARLAASPSATRTELADTPDLPPERDALAAVEVIRPGMQTTVQDLGRAGHRPEGVPQAGAADSWSLRVANALVGNAESAAGLEFTLVGPVLHFRRDAVVAFAGADFGLPRWRPLNIAAGDTLHVEAARSGCRGYLAIAGGIEVPLVLGSRSTYLRGGFGGVRGTALRAGELLRVPPVRRTFAANWRVDPRVLPDFGPPVEVRVIPGGQAAEFDPAWCDGEFTVSPHSDRMGVRLHGPPLTRTTQRELISSPVAPGTVQVPPDGRPIVLLADAQTIGGYPQIAHVITPDLARIAQCRPGDVVRFRPITTAQARELFMRAERALGILREGLAQKLA